MSDPEEGQPEEEPVGLPPLDPEDYKIVETKKGETERRKRIAPWFGADYIAGVPMDDIIARYGIPEGSIHYYLAKMGISRAPPTRKEVEKKQKVQKKIRDMEVRELSIEAEKISTYAIGIGGQIARRYLPMIDSELAEGKTLPLIAIDMADWYERKFSILAEVERLKVEKEELRGEMLAAYEMSLPNFKYWLRTRILERYLNNVLQARTYGVKIPVRRAMNAMLNELITLEGDLENLYAKGEELALV